MHVNRNERNEQVMDTYEEIGNYFTIGHIVQFTGLTDRTIRNYLSAGLLTGEKINGVWHFTSEQIEAFVRHPSVRPSILARRNGVVYDFLLNSDKSGHQCCIILDFPGEDSKELSEYFCYSITTGNYHDINFSLDGVSNIPRIILKGDTTEVLRLVNSYYQKGK